MRTGKLRLVKADLPLSIHPLAFRAAQATECAASQGKFWEMHDRLFQAPEALQALNQQAESIDLNMPEFEACMSAEASSEAVRRDMELARTVGAVATPSFVLGRIDPDDPARMVGISFIRGARPYEDFKAEIDRALEQLKN